MKAVPFAYCRPSSLDEACATLSADDGARVIAGGQTLVPLMAMRLSRPSVLVDIARLKELAYVREQDGGVCIGAATRQCVVERDPLVAVRLPLLAQAIPWIGHAATRARGTIGGSLANADPAAEIALVATTLEATISCRIGDEVSEFVAGDYFLGPMITALPTGACLTSVTFSVWRDARVGVGFHEINARRSDFAFASAAAQIALDEDGACRRIAIGLGAITDFPMRLNSAEQALTGRRLAEAIVRTAVRDALASVETTSDLHASASYRRRAAETLATRAILDAHAGASAVHAH
jgi:CO/xanthine dehydrogenase FAD-binding subunit